jgi:hypothetical protein
LSFPSLSLSPLSHWPPYICRIVIFSVESSLTLSKQPLSPELNPPPALTTLHCNIYYQSVCFSPLD